MFTVIYNLFKHGTKDGQESARFIKHKLIFILFNWRVYKVESERRTFEDKPMKTYYIITDMPLPKFKYKVFIIKDALQRLNDYIFIWRQKK